jgi:hypothetical protein
MSLVSSKEYELHRSKQCPRLHIVSSCSHRDTACGKESQRGGAGQMANANEAKDKWERERQRLAQVREDEYRGRCLSYDLIRTENHDLVEKFLEIAERTVSVGGFAVEGGEP